MACAHCDDGARHCFICMEPSSTRPGDADARWCGCEAVAGAHDACLYRWLERKWEARRTTAAAVGGGGEPPHAAASSFLRCEVCTRPYAGCTPLWVARQSLLAYPLVPAALAAAASAAALLLA